MPDEYDRIRDPYTDNATRGRVFENGANELFRDGENGYVKRPDPHQASRGARYYDKARADELGRVHAIEDKSGRVGSTNDVLELKKDRELLARGEIESLRIRTVDGEQMSSKYRELLKGLQREFGDRVIHQVLTREQARAAFAKGLAREKDARQLELKTRYELNRQDRARKRLPKIRAIAKAKEHSERVQNMGRFLDGATVGQADVAKRAAVRREAAERAERERVARERQQQRDAADRLAQAAQRAREAAANGQVHAFDGREIADLLKVSRPTPGIESPYREPPSAGSTRGGREERGRERGIERDRW